MRIMQMADNAGATDEHRALNYCAVRYPAIYAKAAEEFAQNSSLTAVEVRPSPLSGTRKIVEVIFSYTNRQTDVTEKFFVRVDVTEEFLFLQAKLNRYTEIIMIGEVKNLILKEVKEVSKMNFPGFTAKDSLYRKSGYYESVASQSYGSKKQAIIPQLPPCDIIERNIAFFANGLGKCVLEGLPACVESYSAHLTNAMQNYSLLGC